MNEQELRMVLDALRSLSGDASTAAVWWMALHYGTRLFTVLIVVVAVAWTLKTALAYMTGLSEWQEAGRSVSRAWGGGSGSFMFNEDKDAIDRAIKAGNKKQEKA
jgi:hypothetical protein